jgi:hypothetical protein
VEAVAASIAAGAPETWRALRIEPGKSTWGSGWFVRIRMIDQALGYDAFVNGATAAVFD